MYSSWPQTPPQLHVSINGSLFICWVKMKLLYTLCDLLSIPPSAFLLYYLCTPSASSLSSSFSSLQLIFVPILGLRVFSFRLLPPQGISLTNLLSSFCPLQRFIVGQLPGIPHAGDGTGFQLLYNIADLALCLIW